MDYKSFKNNRINQAFSKENFGLSQIEIVFSDLCNRTCSFCPRGVDYPNSNDNMSVEDAELIRQRLIEFNYKGAATISGKGEPLLNKKAVECIKKLKQWKPLLITNGDPLLKDETLVERMFEAGLGHLIISEYDSEEKLNMWYRKYKDYPLFVRNLIGDFSYEEASISNRGGAMYSINESLEKACYLPFYKTVIDFDAKVQFCNNDWTYKYEIGDLRKQSLKEIWLSEEMMMFRKLLANGMRDKIKMCENCDVKGNMIGQLSFNYFRENHEIHC